MTWCNICNRGGHLTKDCWYKPNYIKEIKTENGKLKKTYTLSFSNKNQNQDDKNTKRIDKRSKTRTPSPDKHPIPKSKNENQLKIGNRSIKRQQTTITGEIEIIEIIKPTQKQSKSIASKCSECLKWDMRMQHSLKYQEITRNDDKRIIKSITDENIKLRQEIEKLKQERDCFKKLFEINKK